MSKLLQRLSDANKSGVYRTSRSDEICAALDGSQLVLRRIELTGATSKQALLERIASQLAFPAWFGGNWDALADCLADLSWSPAAGQVLLFEGAAGLDAEDLANLTEILAEAAASWAARQRPFFAVFLYSPPAGKLPELYRTRPRSGS